MNEILSTCSDLVARNYFTWPDRFLIFSSWWREKGLNRGFAGRPIELIWLPFYRFSWDFLAFPAILSVRSIGRSIAKTIVTILI